MYSLCVDIGGTKVNMGLLDARGNVVIKNYVVIGENKDPDRMLRLIEKNYREMAGKLGISDQDMDYCGMGIPGTVDPTGRITIKVPNLGWKNELIADMFESMTGIRTGLLQDSRAAAYGEYMAGGAKGSAVFVCITLGTGIGTGIIIDGKILSGGLGCAGEIGHVPVVADGRKCGCGREGCLECYAAGKGLDLSAKEMFGPEATALTLFNAAKSGNTVAKIIIDKAVEMLGREFVSIINLLSPDCMLFSGGLSRQKELFLDPIIDYVMKHSYFISRNERLRIGESALGVDAPMIGAGLYRR